MTLPIWGTSYDESTGVLTTPTGSYSTASPTNEFIKKDNTGVFITAVLALAAYFIFRG